MIDYGETPMGPIAHSTRHKIKVGRKPEVPSYLALFDFIS